MNFLPKDYKAPKSSNYYMKLQDGENKIRILTQPVLGWEDWTAEKRPVRFKLDNKPLKPIDPKKPLKHFWAFVVWNYAEEQIQVLHVTQAGIRNKIEALCKDTDWGAPYFYDLKIIKSGEGKDTEYMINPLPHKPLNPVIKEMFNERPVNLDALFDNADPFSKEWDVFTPGIFSESAIIPEVENKFVPKEQMDELKAIISECDFSYQEQLMETLRKPSINVKCIEELPIPLYDRIKKAAIKKRDEYQSKNESLAMAA